MDSLDGSGLHSRALLRIATSALALSCCGCGADEATLAAGELEASLPHGAAANTAGEGLHELLAELGVRWRREARELEIDGWINQREGPIEVLACAPSGKTHESVLVLDCVPRGLHAGLLALGLEPGAPAGIDEEGAFFAPTGDGVALRVRWTDPGGEGREAPAEEFVLELGTDATMPETAWIFTGSIETSQEASATYAADEVESLITTFLDPTSVLENPHGGGRGDEAYVANAARVPEVGTPITLVLRAAREVR